MLTYYHCVISMLWLRHYFIADEWHSATSPLAEERYCECHWVPHFSNPVAGDLSTTTGLQVWHSPVRKCLFENIHRTFPFKACMAWTLQNLLKLPQIITGGAIRYCFHTYFIFRAQHSRVIIGSPSTPTYLYPSYWPERSIFLFGSH